MLKLRPEGWTVINPVQAVRHKFTDDEYDDFYFGLVHRMLILLEGIGIDEGDWDGMIEFVLDNEEEQW